MNPRTIITIAKSAAGVLELAARTAENAGHWLEINQIASSLRRLLGEIEQRDYVDRQVRQDAHDANLGLDGIQFRSSREYERIEHERHNADQPPKQPIRANGPKRHSKSNSPQRISALSETEQIELVKQIAQTNFRNVADQTGYSRGSLSELVAKNRGIYEQFRTKQPPLRSKDNSPILIDRSMDLGPRIHRR